MMVMRPGIPDRAGAQPDPTPRCARRNDHHIRVVRARGYRRTMARLTAAERSKLPDRAFAYVDSAGARRLPIVDAAHVRNALARFDQVQFEDDDARDEARIRLL